MNALFFFYQFWGLIFYCIGVLDSQIQWLRSLNPMIPPLSMANDIPWLVSMTGTCQGIILSPRWILSTANCLTKLKHLQSDISSVINEENIFFGHKICLHPSFDQQVKTNPVKGDIGMVLLQYPIKSEEIPLSQMYNIFRKSCYNCQYRHCRIYQQLNHNKFRTNIKNLSVKLLDLSLCHHQHTHLTESNNLCIWTQSQEDCSVQQGSPVFCFFGNQWKLVGLVSQSSVACYDPIIVIKTAPYGSWMRWLMKAPEKSLDPIFHLPCSFFPVSNNSNQDRLSLNRNSAILSSYGLSIQSRKRKLGLLPLTRQNRNPIFFGSNNGKTLPESAHLYLQSSQLFSANESQWTSLAAKLWDTLDITELWSTPLVHSFEPLIFSSTQKLSMTDIPIPWDLPQGDIVNYQHQSLTDSKRPWVNPLVGINGFNTLPLVNAGGSWILFSSDIDASQIHSEVKTVQSQMQSTNLPLHSQLPAKPWLEITPHVGSWTNFIQTKTAMQIQTNEESVRTQIYHASDRVNTIFKSATYTLHSWIPFTANKTEFWTYSTVNAEGFQYSKATHFLETLFQPVLSLIGAQGSIKKIDEHWSLPESNSNQILTSSELYIPFTWVPSVENSVRIWDQYKFSTIRYSHQMDRIPSLSKHKTFIVNPYMGTEGAPRLLMDTDEPFIHSKIATLRPWIHSEAEIIRPLTVSETGSYQSLKNPEVSTFRHWTQPKVNSIMPLTRVEVDPVGIWLQTQTAGIRTWNLLEPQKMVSWSESEATRIKSWYHSQMGTFKPWLETEFQTTHSEPQLEGEITRPWSESEANIKLWFRNQMETITLLTESVTQTAYYWMHPETEIIRPWSQHMVDKMKAWIQYQTYAVRPTWDEYGDMGRLWTTFEVDTVRLWIQSDDSIITPWTQNYAGILIPYTQTESSLVNSRTQTETETSTLLTQGKKTVVSHWLEILAETRTKSEFSGLKSLTYPLTDTAIPWTQTEPLASNPSLRGVANTLIPLVKGKPSEMDPWAKSVFHKITVWAQSESSTTHPENDTVALLPQLESLALNPWRQSIVNTVTPWIQDESSEIIWTKIVSDQVFLWMQTDTSINHWIQSETETLWTQAESATVNPLRETVAGTFTQQSQAESLVFNSWPQIITDTETQSETPSLHSWTESEIDTTTTSESLVVNFWKGCETGSASSWSMKGYPEIYLWEQAETDIITTCAQVETPGVNSWTKLMVDTDLQRNQPDSPIVDLWAQSTIHVDTLWTQTDSLVVTSWTEYTSDHVTQWTVTESQAINQWTQTSPDIGTSFSQAEFPVVESWADCVADTVTVWTELETTAINTWTELVADTVTPLNQGESLSVSPRTALETDRNILWTDENSNIINLLIETVFHTVTLWTQSVILNPWRHFETDSVMPWAHPESPAANSWIQYETNPFTMWSENRYPSFTPLIHTEVNTFIPWSQPESTTVNSWIHLENDIVTAFIQGESPGLNQSAVVVASTVRLLNHVDSPKMNPLTQAINDRGTLWTKSETPVPYLLPLPITSTVTVWNMGVVVSEKFWSHSVTESFTQWTQNELPPVYSLTHSVTNSVTLVFERVNPGINPRMRPFGTAFTRWTQPVLPEENAWVVHKTVTSWTMEFSSTTNFLIRTLSDTITPRIKSEFVEVKTWSLPESSANTLWTQAEPPKVNIRTQSQVNVVTEWTHIDSPTNTLTQAKFSVVSLWTQSELPTLNMLTEPTFPVLYPSIQTEDITVISLTRTKFTAIYPWIEVSATTAALWLQTDSVTINPRTASDTDPVALYREVESPLSKFLTKSEKHRGPSWTQTEFPVNPMIQNVDNRVTMWTKIESPVLKPWEQAITSTLTQWNQIEFPTVNFWIETVVSTGPSWVQFEYPRVNSQSGTIASTVAQVNHVESLTVIPCSETSISRVTLQIQNSTLVNPCPQTIVTIKTTFPTEIVWSESVDVTIMSWNITESLADTVASEATIWTQVESSAANSRAQTVDSIITSWKKVKYVTINPWTEILSSTVTIWTQTEFPAVNIWTQTVTVFSTILPWTQIESPANYLTQTVTSTTVPWIQTLSPEYPLTMTVSSTVTCWTHSGSLGVNTCKKTVIDRVIFWILPKSEPKIDWPQPKASILTISLHPQSDTTKSLTQVKKQASLLGTNLEISNTQILPLSGILISWIVPFSQAAIFLPKPETYMSRSFLKTQAERMTFWTHSEPQIVNTLTQSGVERDESLAQYENDPLTLWIPTKTVIILPWNQFERDTVRNWAFSGADTVRSWIQTDGWVQYKGSVIMPWTETYSKTINLQTQAEITTTKLLTQVDMNAMSHLAMAGINNVISWYQNQSNTVKQGTQSESPKITSWIQQEWQIFHSWIQSEAKTVIPMTQWSQPESQVVNTLTETDTVSFWNPTLNVATGPWSQTDTQMIYSVIPKEVAITNPWTQYETSLRRSWTDIQTGKAQTYSNLEAAIIRPWNQYKTVEINPSIQPEAGIAIRPLFQTQVVSIKPSDQSVTNTIISCTQPETGTSHILIQDERQTVKIPSISEFETLTSYLQTPGDTTRLWIQLEPQSVSSWTQTEVGVILSYTQQRSATDQVWAQTVKPWIKLEANSVMSWFHIQMYKVRSWAYSKSQTFSISIHPEIGIVHPWIQPKTQAFKPSNHPENESTASAALPKPDTDRIQSEMQINNSTQYKADIITLYTSLQVEPVGATTTFICHFDSWSKPISLLQKEAISFSYEYFSMFSTQITATESQVQISEFTNSFSLTLSSSWLSERVDYLSYDSKLQVTKKRGDPYMLSSSFSPISPSFSFLTPFSLTFSALSTSCPVFSSYIFTSYGISSSCSILSPVTFFSSVLLPLAPSGSSLQEPLFSKFTEKALLSHSFSSLFAIPATPLTKEPPLIHGSQSEINSNPEQAPLKYTELNISLAECRLHVVWKESFQTLAIFKTAFNSHETTECGLRPGLIPHCPNCWEAEVGEFPWMVSVQLSFSHFCAGSILNQQWILTTARCANFIKNSEGLALVQVGFIDLQDSAQAQTVGIHHVMPYLGPKGPLGPGLLFLKQPLHFQPLVLPICLAENMEQDKNIQLYDCWLPSWSLMRGSPGILQKRQLSIMQVSTCAQFWPKLNEFTFCVEAKKAMGEAGCKGDLGAPLVCRLQQKDTWVQVGILSHFDEHCTKPYVFSHVSPFLFWLQGVTRPSRAPWSQQGPMTTSASDSLSVSTSTSVFTSTPASTIWPHFISLPQPQTLADRVSLRYAMPWQVMIISCGNQICSGSIISSSWVLTAAHCVRHMTPEDTAVILGLKHPGTPLKVLKVSAILLHERFRLVSGTARSDLALLLLQEAQTPIHFLAPLGSLKNLNTSECWLAGPRILKEGETDENLEVLQMQVMGASSCTHFYPDIGSSIICFFTQTKNSTANVEPVSPGSAVICRPISGSGSWRQIGLTSLKTLATIVSPHFSWILASSAKTGHPVNQALMPWLEKPSSSSFLIEPTTLLLLPVMIIAVFCDPVVVAN